MRGRTEKGILTDRRPRPDHHAIDAIAIHVRAEATESPHLQIPRGPYPDGGMWVGIARNLRPEGPQQKSSPPMKHRRAWPIR